MNKITLGIAALVLPMAAHTSAGRALFVDGVVKVKRGEETRVVGRGFKVESGDVIETGANARAHLRMSDRTLISLRPETEFGVEEFVYKAASPTQSGTGKASKGVFRLLRGAMRAITGAIAADNRANFSVQTRVAAIGVRGTTFDVACVNVCADGVVFGVSDGSIVATTQAGSIVLETNEYGFAAAPNRMPTRLVASPRELRDDLTSKNDEESKREKDKEEINSRDDGRQAARDDDLAEADKDSTRRQKPEDGRDDTSIEETEKPLAGARQDIAYAAGPLGAASDGAALNVRSLADSFAYNANGELIAFGGLLPSGDGSTNEVVRYSLSQSSSNSAVAAQSIKTTPTAPVNATNVESGQDPDSGIFWGRWSGGNAYARRQNGSVETIDLSASSLHYIFGQVQDESPEMPTTGMMTYDLIGNTDPTDERGNRGVLGGATLVANFTNQTVDSTLSLVVDSQNWAASGTGDIGAALGSGNPANAFGGDYTTVNVNGSPGGSGAFAGFFAEGAEAAGMSYVLNGSNGGSPTIVTGVAAFAEN